MQEQKDVTIQDNAVEQPQISWEESLLEGCLIAPSIDMYEDNDNYYLQATMPGIERDNIKLKIEENVMILMGKNDDEEEKRWLIRESSCGNYYRKIRLSDSVKIDEIGADYKNGKLYVTMPKQENIKPKDIEIK